METFTSNLKDTILHRFHDIDQFLLSVFELVRNCNNTENNQTDILTKILYMDNGQLELCPNFLKY